MANYPVYGPYLRAKTNSGDGRMGCYSVHSLIDSPEYPVETDQTKLISKYNLLK